MCVSVCVCVCVYSTIIKALFATPQDACATSVHACVCVDVKGGQYWARGRFADDSIVKV